MATSRSCVSAPSISPASGRKVNDTFGSTDVTAAAIARDSADGDPLARTLTFIDEPASFCCATARYIVGGTGVRSETYTASFTRPTISRTGFGAPGRPTSLTRPPSGRRPGKNFRAKVSVATTSRVRA